MSGRMPNTLAIHPERADSEILKGLATAMAAYRIKRIDDCLDTLKKHRIDPGDALILEKHHISGLLTNLLLNPEYTTTAGKNLTKAHRWSRREINGQWIGADVLRFPLNDGEEGVTLGRTSPWQEGRDMIMIRPRNWPRDKPYTAPASSDLGIFGNVIPVSCAMAAAIGLNFMKNRNGQCIAWIKPLLKDVDWNLCDSMGNTPMMYLLAFLKQPEWRRQAERIWKTTKAQYDATLRFVEGYLPMEQMFHTNDYGACALDVLERATYSNGSGDLARDVGRLMAMDSPKRNPLARRLNPEIRIGTGIARNMPGTCTGMISRLEDMDSRALALHQIGLGMESFRQARADPNDSHLYRVARDRCIREGIDLRSIRICENTTRFGTPVTIPQWFTSRRMTRPIMPEDAPHLIMALNDMGYTPQDLDSIMGAYMPARPGETQANGMCTMEPDSENWQQAPLRMALAISIAGTRDDMPEIAGIKQFLEERGGIWPSKHLRTENGDNFPMMLARLIESQTRNSWILNQAIEILRENYPPEEWIIRNNDGQCAADLLARALDLHPAHTELDEITGIGRNLILRNGVQEAEKLRNAQPDADNRNADAITDTQRPMAARRGGIR